MQLKDGRAMASVLESLPVTLDELHLSTARLATLCACITAHVTQQPETFYPWIHELLVMLDLHTGKCAPPRPMARLLATRLQALEQCLQAQQTALAALFSQKSLRMLLRLLSSMLGEFEAQSVA